LTIATAEALVGRPRPERPLGLPRQLDLSGPDWEVTAPAAIAEPTSESGSRLRGKMARCKNGGNFHDNVAK
jgi:hypothetical protein